MKTLRNLLLIALLIIIALVLVVYLNIGRIVTTAVNTMGPKATQSEVTLEGFSLNAFTGEGHLTGFTLGNPEGYKTKSAFKVDDISIKLLPKSLLTDTIHITEIIIKAPNVTLEKGLRGSNFEQIQKNIEAFSQSTNTNQVEATENNTKNDTETAEQKPAKKVIIDLIRVEDGQVKLSFKGLQGLAAPIPLPLIELKDIGKDDDDPKNIVEIINMVITKVLGASVGATTDVVKGVGGIGVDSVKGIASLLGTAVGSVTGENEATQEELNEEAKELSEKIEVEAEKAIDQIKDLFK